MSLAATMPVRVSRHAVERMAERDRRTAWPELVEELARRALAEGRVSVTPPPGVRPSRAGGIYLWNPSGRVCCLALAGETELLIASVIVTSETEAA